MPNPVFEDRRNSFLVKFHQMKPVELSEVEQKIIAFVKEHGSIRRAEAQELLEVSDTRAKYVLSKMENAGLLCLVGRQTAARYLIP